jgi:hypothetical protein
VRIGYSLDSGYGISGWTVRVQKPLLDLNLHLDRGKSTGASRTESWAWVVAHSVRVTGLRATHQLGVIHKLCVTHSISINQISVGGLTANEYALDGVPLC